MATLIVRRALALVALGSAASLGCGSAEPGEPEAEVQQPTVYIDCSTATRDDGLNGYATQVAGASSPATFDNPGCDDYYIVEYDGTVSGVHYGYRAATPTNSSQGLSVDFTGLTPPNPNSQPTSTCEDSYAQGILYEKQSDGTWKYITRKLISGQPQYESGLPLRLHACYFATMRFSQVIKGTAAAPHIYRIAMSTYVISHNAAYQAAYPDTVGYGPIHTYAQE